MDTPQVKTIGQQNHLRIEFDSLQDDDTKTLLNRRRLKIVTIDNCVTLNAFNVLNETSVFIVIVNIVDKSFTPPESFLKELGDEMKNAMIWQLNVADETFVFYKEETGAFKNLRLEEVTRGFEFSNNFNFETLCKFLKFQPLFGSFNLKILETAVTMEQSFEGMRLIDWAVQNNDLLSLKFLQLFDPDLETRNNNNSRSLEVAAEKGSAECFKILLNIQEQKDAINSFLKQILSQCTLNKNSLLMIASENGKHDIVDFLTSCDLDVNQMNDYGETASDLAVKSGNFGILLKLLQNDAPYPKSFYINQIKSVLQLARLKMFTELRDNFHEAIRTQDMEDIESFIEQNPKIKYAYDRLFVFTFKRV